MRTKAEVRRFLESRIGTVPRDASNAKLNGQCVALIKDLMNFLGVPGAYNARGNAKDVGDAYIRQGIGKAGRGWLTVCVNRNMGGQYGHVWVDLLNEANYESNGATALRVTKNTRPIGQAQQFINFDQWVQGESSMAIIQNKENWYARCNDTHIRMTGEPLARNVFAAFVGRDFLKFVEEVSATTHARVALGWLQLGKLADKDKWQQQIYTLQGEKDRLIKERNAARDEARDSKNRVQALNTQIATLSKEIDGLTAQLAIQSEDTTNLNALGQALQWFVARVGLNKGDK